MAIKKLKDINKRPRYFAGQYLLEDDFESEQDYSRDRLHRYTRSLHVAGIADGLIASKPSDTTLKLIVDISAGTAIDPQGMQIVLPERRQVNLTKNLVEKVKPDDGSYILSIRYDEQESDPEKVSENNYRRIEEIPIFKLSSSPSSDEFIASDDFIAIAKLTIENGIVSIPNDSNSVRQYTGLRLPSSSKNPLTLRSGGDRASNLAVLSGSLSVEGSLSVTGNVGIGTTSPREKLEISGGNLKVSGDISANNATLTGNVGIGTTTALSKKLQIESGELSVRASNNNEATDIGAFLASDRSQGIGIRCNSIQAIGNNPNQNINLSPKGQGQGIVQVNGGLVVTGSVNFPQTLGQKLTLWSSDYGIGLQNNTQYFRTYQNFAWYKGGSHNDNSLNPGGGTVQMVINNGNVGIGYNDAQQTAVLAVNGNVGIGTTSPADKLEISGGNLKVSDGNLKVSGGNLKVSGDISANKATFTGNVGVGTASSVAKLQVGDKIVVYENYDFTKTTLLVNSQSPNVEISQNGVTQKAASESLLALVREGKAYKSWANMADFRLSRYGPDTDVEASTQLDIHLTDGKFVSKQVMTLIANGNVGIGTTTPSANLHVNGRIKDKTGWVMPVGSILPYAGTTAPPPEGWLLCNGDSLESTAYAELFKIIGFQYGGSVNKFKLPNLQGRVPVGLSTEDEFKVLAQVGGAKTHLLTQREMPSHTHDVNDPGHSHEIKTDNGAGEGGVDNASQSNRDKAETNPRRTGITIKEIGGGQEHNNLQPYITINYIIKY